MSKIKTLRDQQAAKAVEARSILTENPDGMSAEVEARFDAIMADHDGLQKRIDAEQKVIDAESRIAARIAEGAERHNRSDGEEADTQANYRSALDRYMRFGLDGLSTEQRQTLRGGYQAPDESRAQSVSGGSPAGIYGGYVVAPEFDRTLERAMLAFGGADVGARRIVTATGAALTMPNSDDTGNSGAILGENQPVTETDIVFTQTTLNAFKYTSKLIRVSWELLQDSAIDVESFVAEIAGERIGRVTNNHFTVGNGTTQPQGYITGGTSGVTAAGTTGVSLAELINLEHSVGRAYRDQGIYKFNDNTLKALRKMLDADGRPLWQPSLTAGVPTTFNGRSYVINDDMADMAAAAKPIAFGDFSRFMVRQVKGYTLVRLDERYADLGQVGFLVFARFDSGVRDAGKAPIKYITMKSASP